MLHKLCIKDLFYFYTLGLQVDFSSFSIVEWSLTVNRTEDVWTDWNVDDSTRGKGVHSLQTSLYSFVDRPKGNDT